MLLPHPIIESGPSLSLSPIHQLLWWVSYPPLSLSVCDETSRIYSLFSTGPNLESDGQPIEMKRPGCCLVLQRPANYRIDKCDLYNSPMDGCTIKDGVNPLILYIYRTRELDVMGQSLPEKRVFLSSLYVRAIFPFYDLAGPQCFCY